MKNKLYAGIDIGGTNTAIGIVDTKGNITARGTISTVAYPDIADYVEEIHAEMSALTDVANLEGIGIGAPNVDADGNIAFCENLPWRPPVPLAAMMHGIFGKPVAIANDANAAAIGEMTFGAARGLSDFVMLTLSTGVGSGIVTGGRLLTGKRGFAGELGHLTVIRENARSCGCGASGCLEAYCSATGVARTAREMLAANPSEPSLLREIAPEALDSRKVYEAATRGDRLASQVFSFTGKILGQAMAEMAVMTDPEAFILFGGLMASGDYLLAPAREWFGRSLMPMWNAGDIQIRVSELKAGDAAILGAAALVQNLQLRQF